LPTLIRSLAPTTISKGNRAGQLRTTSPLHLPPLRPTCRGARTAPAGSSPAAANPFGSTLVGWLRESANTNDDCAERDNLVALPRPTPGALAPGVEGASRRRLECMNASQTAPAR